MNDDLTAQVIGPRHVASAYSELQGMMRRAAADGNGQAFPVQLSRAEIFALAMICERWLCSEFPASITITPALSAAANIAFVAGRSQRTWLDVEPEAIAAGLAALRGEA